MAASAPFAVEHNRQACVGTIEDQFRPPRFASRQHRGRTRNSPAVLEGTCQVAQPNSFGKRQKETGVCGEAKLRQTDKETELVILKARGRIEVEILLHRSRPVPPVPLLFSSSPVGRQYSVSETWVSFGDVGYYLQPSIFGPHLIRRVCQLRSPRGRILLDATNFRKT